MEKLEYNFINYFNFKRWLIKHAFSPWLGNAESRDKSQISSPDRLLMAKNPNMSNRCWPDHHFVEACHVSTTLDIPRKKQPPHLGTVAKVGPGEGVSAFSSTFSWRSLSSAGCPTEISPIAMGLNDVYVYIILYNGWYPLASPVAHQQPKADHCISCQIQHAHMVQNYWSMQKSEHVGGQVLVLPSCFCRPPWIVDEFTIIKPEDRCCWLSPEKWLHSPSTPPLDSHEYI